MAVNGHMALRIVAGSCLPAPVSIGVSRVCTWGWRCLWFSPVPVTLTPTIPTNELCRVPSGPYDATCSGVSSSDLISLQPVTQLTADALRRPPTWLLGHLSASFFVTVCLLSPLGWILLISNTRQTLEHFRARAMPLPCPCPCSLPRVPISVRLMALPPLPGHGPTVTSPDTHAHLPLVQHSDM